MWTFTQFLWILLAIACGYYCFYLARIKGRSPEGWAILGAVLGPLAIGVLWLLKPVPKNVSKEKL